VLLWDVLTSATRKLSDDLMWLGNEALRTPVIGNWCAQWLWDRAISLSDTYIDMVYFGYWLDDAQSRLAQILSWDQTRANIMSAWTWINTIDDKIAVRVAGIYPWLQLGSAAITDWVLAKWSYLNTIDDKIANRIASIYPWLQSGSAAITDWVLARWAWLNTIDDKIAARVASIYPWLQSGSAAITDWVLARWSYLNNIDDKIRDVAWTNIAPKLGDWFWSFMVLNVTLVSKIGYRVLSTLWNMEWDDTNNEAK
jgi:hypothetical protein